MSASADPLPTQFAPAERAAPETIAAEATRFRTAATVCEMLEAVPDGLVVLNAQRQIVYANGQFLGLVAPAARDRLLGARPGEALGCINAGLTDGGCGTTEFCRTCGAVQAILAAQQGQRSIRECRILRRQGEATEALDLRVHATPLRLADETYTVFAVCDISDEKRRLALERIFFHDVLNTAGVLVNLSEIAEMEKDSKDEERWINTEFLSVLRRSSALLVDEIQAQRQLLLAEQGELATHPQPLQALDVLRDLVSLYRQHRVCRRKHLELDPASGDATLATDPAILRRVVGNMIKNALEACANDQTTTVGCAREDADRVSFSVHNPGQIPREVQLQIFQRSFSTKGEGRGLGTYSIKLLTERYLHGAVSFRSDAAGTCFRIVLPRG